MLLSIVIMLFSAATYALAFVLQHKGTQSAIGDGVEKPGVGRLARSPAFVIGVLLLSPAFILHIAALSLGSVAVVQPLIVTELAFIPLFSALISKTRISGRDWAAIVAVTLGLGGFLLIANPSEGVATAPTSAWIITSVGFIVALAILYAIGSRQNIVVRAAIFGVCAGLVNALLALYGEGAFSDPSSLGGLIANPLLYLTIVAALVTVVTNAIAFKSGPITSSTPAMVSINPIVSVLVSLWLFQVTIRHTPIAIVGILVCVAVVGYGIVALTKSSPVHETLESEAELLEDVTGIDS